MGNSGSYGLGTIFTGIFPCDSGRNRELIDPSFSQIVQVIFQHY